MTDSHPLSGLIATETVDQMISDWDRGLARIPQIRMWLYNEGVSTQGYTSREILDWLQFERQRRG